MSEQNEHEPPWDELPDPLADLEQQVADLARRVKELERRPPRRPPDPPDYPRWPYRRRRPPGPYWSSAAPVIPARSDRKER